MIKERQCLQHLHPNIGMNTTDDITCGTPDEYKHSITPEETSSIHKIKLLTGHDELIEMATRMVSLLREVRKEVLDTNQYCVILRNQNQQVCEENRRLIREKQELEEKLCKIKDLISGESSRKKARKGE